MNHLWQVNLIQNGHDFRKLNFLAASVEDAVSRARAWIKELYPKPVDSAGVEIVCVVRRQEVEV